MVELYTQGLITVSYTAAGLSLKESSSDVVEKHQQMMAEKR